ncbi:unnamed protein product [Brassicogethes aeneus]|uniref:CCDC66 domain-containing protein n=1 Tax=Brassicogethes aeneus TaxID=1431903 RepID=A0A9P0FAX2_BRAAE|nr:unnamed protein product [Brassicogethes aeneus]
MSTTYIEKSISLVEKKKQQWAKEREELARISGYWRQSSEPQHIEGFFDRNNYASNTMVPSSEYDRRSLKGPDRRSSLPPLYKNQYNSREHYEREKEQGGETSGYGSDNSPEFHQVPWSQSGPRLNQHDQNLLLITRYESSSSRDDRPKWGDKGVVGGKFWTPKEEVPEKNLSEPPNWVKRGLKDGEIVVSNQSPAESPEQTYEDPERPSTGCSSNINRTYIRGQNIPLDSLELAERERKRHIALEHQQAIRQQLEERERKRREERERKIQEEREEELRIEREQEVERQRQEHEQRLLKEKLERERKRKEAIQEAIEVAQREAKLAKMRQKMSKFADNNEEVIVNMNMTENILEKKETDADEKALKSTIITDSHAAPDNNNNNNNKPAEPKKEILNNDSENNSETIPKLTNILNDTTECKSLTPRQSNAKNYNTPRTDYQALIFQSPLEILQSLPYAVLVPSTPMNYAVPLSDIGTSMSRTENRILTPTQYRNKNSRLCDSSTQTDPEYTGESSVREKFGNLELTYDNRSSRKDRRSRLEDVEDRPKWGANRPPTRYLKQSEKDLLYQRRKLRQKVRDDKNSSDESQMGSPRAYRKKGYVDKRALWRKDGRQVFNRNVGMYQTEIVPLETDKDRLYYRQNEEECCCRCRHNVKVDILKIEHSPRENRLPDCVQNENSEVLEKLSNLHNGLLLKQEQWKNSPRTPSLSSSKAN